MIIYVFAILVQTNMCVHINNYADKIVLSTCYKRPPVLSDRFCWVGRAVAQERFYSIRMFVLYVNLILNGVCRKEPIFTIIYDGWCVLMLVSV